MIQNSTMTKTAGDGATQGEATRSGLRFRPACDIVETRDELTVTADMPGVKSGQIDVRFEDGLLTVHAPVEPRQTGDENFLLCEYAIGDFQRTFRINETIDASKINAEYSDGVLTLHLPKSEAAKPRKISVKTS
jgi:HSP20 family protein